MKKTFTYLSILLACLSYNYSEAQFFNFNVPLNICLGGSTGTCNAQVTYTMGGANSYSWAVSSTAGVASFTPGVNGINVAMSFTTCGSYTLTCYPCSASIPIPASQISKVFNVSCASGPILTVNSSGPNVCAGSPYVLSATGATSYTWVPGGFTASTFTIFPNASTCFTVWGSNGSACIAASETCVNVISQPTVQVPPIGVCLGSTGQLTATGASSYLWNTGATTSVISVSPLTGSCYTVIGTTNGCTNTAVGCVLVNPLPNVGIAAMSTSICAGSSFNLIATGANTYTWSNGLMSASVLLSPLANTCYSVIGSNTFGCMNMASICVTVAPWPPISLPLTTTVCLGSSVLLSVSGASSYLWTNGAITPSISVSPTITTTYSVVATAANGCTNSAGSFVVVNTTCSDVWPGDANSDGIVDNTDVFEIGLAFSNTGSARTPGGNVYVGQFANNWSGTISTGKNKCHADCNGDGIINNGDTLAIYNNYSLTHAFRSSEISSVGDINLVITQPFVNGGQWNKADIVAGSASSPISQLYGLAYDLNFDKSMIQTDSVYVVYTSSFLNTSNPNVNFRKTLYNSEVVHCANVRTNGANINGDGKIGELWFKVKTGLPENTQLALSVSNAKKIGSTGAPATLSGGSTVLTIANTTGIAALSAFKNTVNLFPNPAVNKLTLQSNSNALINYSLYDITGRKVLNGNFTKLKTIDVSEYSGGTYIISFESASEVVHRKFVIEK
ncbi:MAG: T9SS type A sorting domain-containing protein [Bacteroidota bacterium]